MGIGQENWFTPPWLLTGLMALIGFSAARAALTVQGMALATAALIAGLGALVDIALGGGMLWCRTSRLVDLGQAATATAYLIGGSLGAPALWLDPIGPLMKIPQVILLALVAATIAGDR